jgi:hypothetical protein
MAPSACQGITRTPRGKRWHAFSRAIEPDAVAEAALGHAGANAALAQAEVLT